MRLPANTPAGSHAALRAKERYGIELTIGDQRELAGLLAAGSGLLLDRSEGKERRLVQFRGYQLIIVFVPATGIIVTILPRVSTLAHRYQKRKKGHGKAGSKVKREGRRPDPKEDFE